MPWTTENNIELDFPTALWAKLARSARPKREDVMDALQAAKRIHLEAVAFSNRVVELVADVVQCLFKKVSRVTYSDPQYDHIVLKLTPMVADIRHSDIPGFLPGIYECGGDLLLPVAEREAWSSCTTNYRWLIFHGMRVTVERDYFKHWIS